MLHLLLLPIVRSSCLDRVKNSSQQEHPVSSVTLSSVGRQLNRLSSGEWTVCYLLHIVSCRVRSVPVHCFWVYVRVDVRCDGICYPDTMPFINRSIERQKCHGWAAAPNEPRQHKRVQSTACLGTAAAAWSK